MSIFIRDVGAATSKITTHWPKAGEGTLGTSDVGSDSIEDGQRTPADEAIFFFETSPATDAQPVQLYELRLDEDGAPSKDKAVCALWERINVAAETNIYRQYIRLPPPYVPYVLRVSIDAGSPATRNGIFKTNFPLDGGIFDRDSVQERM